MKITKFGHCCLLIEVGEARILTDPGSFNKVPEVTGLDAILITHEHPDHLHIESLQKVLEKNPEAKIISHTRVGELLAQEKLSYQNIADGEIITLKGIPIESCGSKHACIHADWALVANTGFYINKTFFYPGDALHNPNKKIDVLALPVCAPWMRLEEAIEYAKALKPKVVIPVHDGMLRQDHRLEYTRRIPKTLLEPLGIEFRDMTEGSVEEFL